MGSFLLAVYGIISSLVHLTTAKAIDTRGNSSCPSGYFCTTITLTYAKLAPDGYSRNVYLINGTFPGPLIQMNQNQIAWVTVINNTPNNQTVHWHGVEQLGTPWSDGVPGVSQYAIQPNQKFLYKWNATEHGQYWYHSHDASYLSDGLFGPLLVHPAPGTNKPFGTIAGTSKSTLSQLNAAEASPNVAMVGDWSHHESADFQAVAKAADVDIYCYDSLLVNGKGSTICLSQQEIDSLTQPAILPVLNGTKLTPKGCIPANNTIAQGPYPKMFQNLPKDYFDVCTNTTGPRQVYTVDPSKGWVGFNFIGTGIANIYTIAIDEHKMWVYAVDGHYITPTQVDSLDIFPGTRYSVFVQLSKTAATYTMRFSNPGVDQIIYGYANMTYLNGNPNYVSKATIGKIGQSLITPYVPFDEGAYKIYPPAPPSQTVNRTVRMEINRFGSSYQWTLSGKQAYTADNENNQPLLFNKNQPAATNPNITYTTKMGEWVDVIIQVDFPPSDPEHALHKHGVKAYIIGAGNGTFPGATVADAYKVTPNSFNLVDPPLRDGFLSPGATTNGTWLALRYHVNNAGAFLFHCHMQPHVAGGMAVNFLDGVDQWPTVPNAYLNGNGF